MAVTLNNQTWKLKYLFKATFKDGRTLEQTPEDVSTKDEARSAFRDVMDEAEQGNRVIRFELTEPKMFPDTYAVDLTDGHFEINGKRIEVGEQLPVNPQDIHLRLIYFRRHTHDFNIDLEAKAHRVAYVIGWQTTIAGKNYQQLIAIE